jgi:hypothetical protein
MPNRIVLLVSAVLSSLALILTSGGVVSAADECLNNPNKPTPPGGHWYYRLERGTQRKCWYLADDAAKSGAAKPDAVVSDTTKPAAAVSLETAAAAKPKRPKVQPAPQPPAGNARAEFLDTPRAEQPALAAPAQPDPPQGATADANALPPSSVASRWPSPTNTSVADIGVTAAPAPPPPVPTPSPDAQPTAAPADQAEPVLQQTDGAGDGPDYLLYALCASVLAFTAVLAWAGIRFMIAALFDADKLPRWRRAARQRDDDSGDALLALGAIPMGLSRVSAASARSAAHHVAAPRPLEEEIDEIEELLAVARQASVRTPDRFSSWDVAEARRDAAE